MTILVTGAAGFIGFHVCRALLARGERVLGIDNLNDYYDVRLKEARLALLQGHAAFDFARADISDREAMAAATRAGTGVDRPDRPSRGPGRGAPFAGGPLRLRAGQRDGPGGDAGTLPQAARARALRLRQLQLGLRRRHRGAVLGGCPRRQPHLPLRGEQEGGRADRPRLRAPLRRARDRAPLLHGLRPLGPAGHGRLHLHPGNPGRPADHALQPRPHEAGLHLHRRPGAGGARHPRRRRRPAGAPASPTASTTSATTGPSRSPTSSPSWSARSAARR